MAKSMTVNDFIREYHPHPKSGKRIRADIKFLTSLGFKTKLCHDSRKFNNDIVCKYKNISLTLPAHLDLWTFDVKIGRHHTSTNDTVLAVGSLEASLRNELKLLQESETDQSCTDLTNFYNFMQEFHKKVMA